MVTEERAAEVRALLEVTRNWASQRPDISAVGMAGSWACDEANTDSDVDFVILTRDSQLYIADETWIGELGGLQMIDTKRWGPVTERRLVRASGLEVEAGIAPLSWADLDPVDPGTRRVITDGFRVIYDAENLLGRLVEACR